LWSVDRRVGFSVYIDEGKKTSALSGFFFQHESVSLRYMLSMFLKNQGKIPHSNNILTEKNPFGSDQQSGPQPGC
jgi:hypothetical protein